MPYVGFSPLSLSSTAQQSLKPPPSLSSYLSDQALASLGGSSNYMVQQWQRTPYRHEQFAVGQPSYARRSYQAQEQAYYDPLREYVRTPQRHEMFLMGVWRR